MRELVILVLVLWVAEQAQVSAASAEKLARRKPVAAVNAEAGLAVRGYDPVAYFTDGKPVPGQARFSAKWQGATWQFASAANRTAFLREPARYAPQYGGYCAFGLSQGYTVDINPRQWKIVDGKLYLNTNLFAHSLWVRDPAGHIQKGDANWRHIPRDKP